MRTRALPERHWGLSLADRAHKSVHDRPYLPAPGLTACYVDDNPHDGAAVPAIMRPSANLSVQARGCPRKSEAIAGLQGGGLGAPQALADSALSATIMLSYNADEAI